MTLFSLKGKTAVILGGTGVLGQTMSLALAEAGANVAVCGRREHVAAEVAKMAEAFGGKTIAVSVDTSLPLEVERASQMILSQFGRVDILINAVGGNSKNATTGAGKTFFDLPFEAIEQVVSMNLMAGAVIPSQVFGREMVKNDGGGVIINIMSMTGFRPLTRVLGYSAAKAAVGNFTQWLSVDMCKTYGDKIRVNAIAPGFFLTEQNRFLLTEEQTGELTARGQSIIQHTPMGRFGNPDDLSGTLIWLCSDASRFVTGIIVPVDGGFSAYSGV